MNQHYAVVDPRSEGKKHLLIDTLAQLAVSGGRFEGRSALKTYLFAIGKHLALRHVKLRWRETHLSYVSNLARRLRHCAQKTAGHRRRAWSCKFTFVGRICNGGKY